jgi:hypothetical protein
MVTAASLGYAMDKTLSFDSAPLVQEPILLLALAFVGNLIVVYAEIAIRVFGEHINRNFDRADCWRVGDKSLDEILTFGAAFVAGSLVAVVRLVGKSRLTRCSGSMTVAVILKAAREGFYVLLAAVVQSRRDPTCNCTPRRSRGA